MVMLLTMGIAMIVREGNACDFVPPGDSRALVNALRPCVDNASYLAEVGERAVALRLGKWILTISLIFASIPRRGPVFLIKGE